MASKPDNWNFTVRSLASQFPDGKSAIFAALDELKERGWITFTKRANGQGKYKLETSLEPESDNQYEAMPESDNRTEADQPQSDNRTKEREPESDNPDLGYRTLRKSERISNTDALNNKDLSQGRERNSNSKNQQHDYAVIPEPSTRYDIPSLIDETIFGSN
jgi:DNA-binding transcriptional MocR family regulator